jgi:hypothetical protein
MKSLLTILMLIFAIPLFSWDKAVDKNGIAVFTRSVEGSSLKEFKAETSIAASPATLVSVLLDAESMKQWWPDCVEAKLLQRNGITDWKVYFVMKVPFPLNNRDTINKFELSEDPTGNVKIKISSMPSDLPENEGLVRIPELKGQWTFTKKGELTDVVYQLHANPGGSIPAFVANSTVTDSPYTVLLRLKAETLKPKHANKASLKTL